MKRLITLILFTLFIIKIGISQNNIPLDTIHWEIRAKSYVLENYKGKDAIYLQGGVATLKDTKFLNGTIEFDIFLKEDRAFPGIIFREVDRDAEQFYIRTHLSGKPDANQAAPTVSGITPWQLYFGPKYSFAYDYKYDDWTHVRLVVNNNRAQVYLDYSAKANLSWTLFHTPQEGDILLKGGNASGMHLANFKVNKEEQDIVDFHPIERAPIDGLIPEWEVSDMFEEKLLDNPTNIKAVIESRTWGRKIQVEEGTAANISRVQLLRDGNPGETVFAKITIHSDKDQVKLFEFGYSDRVVAILNGKPVYKGTNRWQSRDYRYLGTIGLFDAIYLDLKKGNNTLLMAVSEDFGGWLITGRFKDQKGIKVK